MKNDENREEAFEIESREKWIRENLRVNIESVLKRRLQRLVKTGFMCKNQEKE